MNSLDSRFLRLGDTFARHFPEPGRYGYVIGLPIPSRHNPEDAPFTINVRPARDERSEGTQHNVNVRHECGRLEADPRELEIEAGDLVLWRTSDPTLPGFSISGHSQADSFSSAALSGGSLYTHAFGTPGVFDWKSADGHGPSGRVIVNAPRSGSARDLESYQERLAQGTLVSISDGKAEPSQVKILAGQTVMFFVDEAAGITITDSTLLVEVSSPQTHFS